MSSFGKLDLEEAIRWLSNSVAIEETKVESTETNIICRNTGVGWETAMHVGSFIEYRTGVNRGLARRITANAGNSLTCQAFPEAPSVGDVFIIRAGTGRQSITQIGGVDQTPRDWTLLFDNLDITLSALRDAIKKVQGDTADGVADTGDPVKIGGTVTTDEPTKVDGARGAASFNLRGGMRVENSTVYVSPGHSYLGVTDVSQLALVANPLRKYALFINNSDSAMFLMFAGAAVINEGIRLNGDGGSYEMTPDTLYRGNVSAISLIAGPSRLLILEGE